MSVLSVARGGAAAGLTSMGELFTGADAVMAVSFGAGGAKLACVQRESIVVYKVDAAAAAEGAASPLEEVGRPTLELPEAEAAAAGAETPPERVPYVVGLDGGGGRLAVGMEDGAVVMLRAAVADGGGWSQLWREKKHKKEVRCCLFTADGGTLATLSTDALLLWPVTAAGAHRGGPPRAVAPPAFTLFKALGGGSVRGRGGKRRVIVPEWRCAAIGAAADGTPLLFAAINHAGGPGWLARIPLGGGAATATVQAYAKVARAPLTAIDVASPARGGIVAVGTNEGEAIVLDGATLAPLTRVQVASDIWVSTLTLSAGPDGTALAACAGDNSLAFAPLSDDALRRRFASGSSLWLSVLVAVVALLLAWMMGGAAPEAAAVEAVEAAVGEAAAAAA